MVVQEQGGADSVQGPGGASAVVAASQAYSGLPLDFLQFLSCVSV